MARYNDVFEDTNKTFTEFIATIDNLSEVNIKVLANNRQKEIGKVVKANDLLRYMTSEDVIIVINERIFEQLPIEQQKMVVEELVARLYFNPENSRLTIINPDVNTFSLFLRKYGFDNYEVLHETIKSLFAKMEEEEAENNQ